MIIDTADVMTDDELEDFTCSGCGNEYPACECRPERDFPDDRTFSDSPAGQIYWEEVNEDLIRCGEPPL